MLPQHLSRWVSQRLSGLLVFIIQRIELLPHIWPALIQELLRRSQTGQGHITGQDQGTLQRIGQQWLQIGNNSRMAQGERGEHRHKGQPVRACQNLIGQIQRRYGYMPVTQEIGGRGQHQRCLELPPAAGHTVDNTVNHHFLYAPDAGNSDHGYNQHPQIATDTGTVAFDDIADQEQGDRNPAQCPANIFDTVQPVSLDTGPGQFKQLRRERQFDNQIGKAAPE